jgi:hypothetical protein
MRSGGLTGLFRTRSAYAITRNVLSLKSLIYWSERGDLNSRPPSPPDLCAARRPFTISPGKFMVERDGGASFRKVVPLRCLKPT